MEVHDCFSITELVTMEDLFISEEARAVADVLDGFYDRNGGGAPCQVDGGLKCFGHPIGPFGLRMAYENYNQLLGRAGKRQLQSPSFGLSRDALRSLRPVSASALFRRPTRRASARLSWRLNSRFALSSARRRRT
jgi:acetyl-CoA acetyltransferase